VPGEGEDRRYPADITAIELLWAETDASGWSSNDAFDTYLLEPSRETLRDALPGVAMVPIPVVVDRTHDGRLSSATTGTRPRPLSRRTWRICRF